jgi:hypothetical protein
MASRVFDVQRGVGQTSLEGVKKSKQLMQSRKGAKKRKGEVPSLLCDLCVLCAFA